MGPFEVEDQAARINAMDFNFPTLNELIDLILEEEASNAKVAHQEALPSFSLMKHSRAASTKHSTPAAQKEPKALHCKAYAKD